MKEEYITNRNFIIGTAGHVDHGKTSLIKALTGIDADRLSVEKERGMTIDLGFAYMDIPLEGSKDNTLRVGIVDVPGHEKFVRNMLSGASGIDVVLLVVDINEGVMPQTREHLDILELLGIQNAVLVLNKIDIFEENNSKDIIFLREEEIRNELKGTIIDSSPAAYVSAKTGQGIEELKQLIAGIIKEKIDESLGNDISDNDFFMPIDRAFSIKGIGTVVTGTTGSGIITAGNEYMLYPEEKKINARTIQVHGKDVDEAGSGVRCAVNITDVSKDNLQRGHFLATSGSLTPAMMLDAKLKLLDNSPFGLKNNALVFFHYGTGQYLAKAVLMDRDYLEPGRECYVQFRFKENIAGRINDRYVIRLFSPQITVGGGVILDNNPVKKRRNKDYVINGFNIKEQGTPTDKAYQYIFEHSASFIKESQILKNGCTKESLDELIAQDKVLLLDNNMVITTAFAASLKDYLGTILRAYHQKNPTYPGMPKAEVVQKLLGSKRTDDGKDIIDYFKNTEFVKEEHGLVSLYLFKHEELKDEELIKSRIFDIYKDAFINPPAYNDMKVAFIGTPVFLAVLKKLTKDGTLIKIDERYYLHEDALKFSYERLVNMIDHVRDGAVTLGDYRDRIKSSRKVALAILEYFDRMGVTVKKGDARYLCTRIKE